MFKANLDNYYYDAEIAEEILNRCTVNNPKIQNFDDHDYTVVFNYEFIEDARDNDNERYDPCMYIKLILFEGYLSTVKY